MKIIYRLISVFLAAGLTIIHAKAGEEKSYLSQSRNFVSYNHPVEENQNRRREAGLIPNGSGSEVRGVTRGATRGATRGVQRGSVRGVNRGVQRGVARGVSRGVTRGASESAEVLPLPKRMEPLSPKATAYTSETQPVLYFYLSSPCSYPITFTLNSEKEIEPLVLEDLALDNGAGRIEAGIHAIDLADYAVELQPGVEYEWFVSIILDEQERSSDFFASATLKYVEGSQELKESLVEANENVDYAVYAQQGYWYDAIDALNKQIQKYPEDKALKDQRANWLEEVTLLGALTYVKSPQME